MKKLILSLLFTLAAAHLLAEVQEVQVKWNAFKCIGPCVDSINQHLKAISNVSDVQINGQGGTAAMKWSPTFPFSYEPFRYAFAAAGGVTINEMRVRVNGTITHDSEHFFLHSTGDNGTFQLIGPIQAQPGRYIPKNLASHPLMSETKDKLLAAEMNRLTVTVSGPLYLPSHWPNVLIAEQIKVNNE